MTLAGELVLDLLAPPAAAAFVWLSSTAWLGVVHGDELTDGARKIRKVGTLVTFVILLVLGFGITLYAHLTGWRYHAR